MALMADSDDSWIDVVDLPPGATVPRASRDRDWSPARALIRGTAISIIPAAALAAVYGYAASRIPEATLFHMTDSVQASLFILLGNMLVAFAASWLLFAVMHRTSEIIGLWATVAVVALTLLIVAVKQIVVAAKGVNLPSGIISGWAVLSPWMFLKTNLGAWIGLIASIHLFHEGESITEIFGSTL